MAHYNFPLRLLRLVQDAERAGTPCMSVGRAVHRLTGEIAAWLGLDAGAVQEGGRADLVVVDPARLDGSLDEVQEAEMPGMGGLRRLVRRNDAAVRAVVVAGRVAAREGQPAAGLGAEPGWGTVLRVGRAAPAPVGVAALA
jgi:N-acyl-D-aspartate/D-glutamate deacylase